MNSQPTHADYDSGGAMSGVRTCQDPPWQIWSVVAVLALEGVGNLVRILSQPVAVWWLAAKVLLIVGLVRGWKSIFVLYLILGTWHVMAFTARSPLVALLNLITVVLVASAYGHFFRTTPIEA